MVVYLDVYFSLNLWMDVLLLATTAAVCRERVKIRRLIAAAVIGAGGACVLLTLTRWWQLLGALITAVGMMRVVFPHLRWTGLARVTTVYIVVAIFLGGAINWWYFEALRDAKEGALGMWQVCVFGGVAAAAIIVGMRGWWQRRKREKNTYRVLLRIQGMDIITTGFLDTGNCLKDEFGRPVHICEREIVGEGTVLRESFNVTYNSLAGEGQVEVVRADRLVVPELNVDEDGALIGLTEKRLFRDGSCHMLLNGVLGEGL